MKKESRFKLRPFISFFLSFSFIHLILSSIVLYIAPPGRFANWSNWKLLGITKGGWEAQHTIVGVLFIFASIVHMFLNWKIFMSYLRSRMRKVLNRIWELTAALVLIVFITLGGQYNWVPFSTVMKLGENLSNSWEQRSLSTDTSAISSSGEGISEEDHPAGTGSGMGRKNLKSVIEENGVEISTALERLKAEGVEASLQDNIKAVSLKYNMGISTIIDIITGKQ